MADNKRRQRVLALVTRQREIEHRVAAGVAAAALSEAERSSQLAERAKTLAAGYGDIAGLKTGHDLVAQLFSGTKMRNIAQETSRQAQHAKASAEVRIKAERQAKNKLDKVEEKAVQLSADQRKNVEMKAQAEQQS